MWDEAAFNGGSMGANAWFAFLLTAVQMVQLPIASAKKQSVLDRFD